MRSKKKRAIQMTLVDANDNAEPMAPTIDVDAAIHSLEKATVNILVKGAVAAAALIVVKTVAEIAESHLS